MIIFKRGKVIVGLVASLLILNQCGAIASDNEDILPAERTYRKAQQEVSLNQLDLAIADFTATVNTLNMDKCAALTSRGNAKLMKGLLAGSANDFNLALKLEPKYAWAHAGLGKWADLSGDALSALVQYRSALKYGLDDSHLHYQLGVDYQMCCDNALAKKEYNEVCGARIEPMWKIMAMLHLLSIARVEKEDTKGIVGMLLQQKGEPWQELIEAYELRKMDRKTLLYEMDRLEAGKATWGTSEALYWIAMDELASGELDRACVDAKAATKGYDASVDEMRLADSLAKQLCTPKKS